MDRMMAIEIIVHLQAQTINNGWEDCCTVSRPGLGHFKFDVGGMLVHGTVAAGAITKHHGLVCWYCSNHHASLELDRIY